MIYPQSNILKSNFFRSQQTHLSLYGKVKGPCDRQYNINMKVYVVSDLLQTSQKSRQHSDSEGRQKMNEKEWTAELHVILAKEARITKHSKDRAFKRSSWKISRVAHPSK